MKVSFWMNRVGASEASVMLALGLGSASSFSFFFTGYSSYVGFFLNDVAI